MKEYSTYVKMGLLTYLRLEVLLIMLKLKKITNTTMKTLLRLYDRLIKTVDVLFELYKKNKVPMSSVQIQELNAYIRSKNMRPGNFFTPKQLKKISFSKAKKYVDNLIEESNKWTFG